MDLTPIFKASVMTVKLRNKNLPVPNKNRILQKQAKDAFTKEVKDVCYKITQLKNILLENRSAYMKFASHLKSSAQMTDEQRDLIDRECEKVINFYTQHIAQMRSEWRQKRSKKQLNEHVENMLELLSNYLKTVQNIHLEQKRYRMQHELDTYRFLKLASDKKKIPVRPVTATAADAVRKMRRESNIIEDYNDEEADFVDDIDYRRKSLDLSETDRKIATQEAAAALDDDIEKTQQQNYNEENELSPEDIQVFESENVQLYHELQGLTEEVEQIEKNVVDIAKLQEIFTEKVALQKHDIDRIANAVVGTTENVKDANEQIKQAIQRNAGLRVWALFFLLVMSFSLLFLDWYND